MEHHDASDGDEATNPFIDEEEPLLEARPRRRRSKTIIVAAGALVVSAAALATRSRTTNLEAENRLPVPLDLANCANFDDDAAMRDGCVGMDSAIFCGARDGELSSSADLFASMLDMDRASLFPILANARKVCGAACENTDEAYFMPCLWEAVARLPAVCAGTFESSTYTRYLSCPRIQGTLHGPRSVPAIRAARDEGAVRRRAEISAQRPPSGANRRACPPSRA